MERNLPHISESTPPGIMPTEEFWNLVRKFAEDHHLSDVEVANRLMQVGTKIARIEEAGGKVVGIIGEARAEINVFDSRRHRRTAK
jgi:hypothetical protein